MSPFEDELLAWGIETTTVVNRYAFVIISKLVYHIDEPTLSEQIAIKNQVFINVNMPSLRY